ncbi:uncharacterized protein B0H18DRAFT_955037 [Fomitopsis serialis]|uniref:uncharacterized protein n=1 Tax=Fomitopsis serialis TaxID=139415 RepID=UPI0020075DA7|nr:uncharacterized protein B0H18DRAFT_955037 [Neoantrodia serialis]KAH9925507.1 hypothetical protein B0H18DRAFT_955037 [Neoantrodia serialis]
MLTSYDLKVLQDGCTEAFQFIGNSHNFSGPKTHCSDKTPLKIHIPGKLWECFCTRSITKAHIALNACYHIWKIMCSISRVKMSSSNSAKSLVFFAFCIFWPNQPLLGPNKITVDSMKQGLQVDYILAISILLLVRSHAMFVTFHIGLQARCYSRPQVHGELDRNLYKLKHKVLQNSVAVGRVVSDIATSRVAIITIVIVAVVGVMRFAKAESLRGLNVRSSGEPSDVQQHVLISYQPTIVFLLVHVEGGL